MFIEIVVIKVFVDVDVLDNDWWMVLVVFDYGVGVFDWCVLLCFVFDMLLVGDFFEY